MSHFSIMSLPYKKRFLALQKEEEQQEPLDLSISTGQPASTTTTSTGANKLRAHLRRLKIKESGRYSCDLCKKNFVQQSSLITHRRIHTGERPYECRICQNTYGDLSTFTKHKRTHSGEKPYQCYYCERRFSQSGNCLRHLRSVHPTFQIRTSPRVSAASAPGPVTSLPDLVTFFPGHDTCP